MAGSSEADPEGGQGSVWVAAVVAQRSGEVDRPSAAQQADGQVAQGRHDLRAGPRPDLGVVLGKGHVPDVVQAVFDHQRVAAATAGSRVADRGQVGQQVRSFGDLQRLGAGELGESGRDRG
jgi:hypothetical protein